MNIKSNNSFVDINIKNTVQADLFGKKNDKALPFLRWAGGKRWLKKSLHNYLPKEGFKTYHEPFVGGGSILFHIQPEMAYISDLNEDLINTYQVVKNDIDLLISHLKQFKNTKENYYKIRATRFNDEIQEAARFIYLNSTSFNGIYRVNLQGEYNVPYGKRPSFQLDYENLFNASKALSNVHISSGDFYNCIKNVQKDDLVFLDPPYTVTHNNNGFIHYNQKIFSIEEQERLSEMIKKLKELDAYYILTNAAHPRIREIFDNGDSILEISRSSTIGGRNAKRGKFSEYIFTNGV